MSSSVTVNELVKTLKIQYAFGEDYGSRQIYTSEVSRPGLALTGFVEDYPFERIQLIGRTELLYLASLPEEQRLLAYESLCNEETPAIIFARDMAVPEDIFAVADKYHVPLLVARSTTTRVLANLTNFLAGRLAERLAKLGVFVEVFGRAGRLPGGRGVGKSETALELVQRGHRLIADDRVELFMIDELTLVGEAPEILQNLLEIRGLGIIDVMSLYGVAAIRRSKRLELIINLVLDDGQTEYDRLGSQREYEQIFEVNVPRIRIPVKTGRNLSAIVESAAMNFRANQMGYDATTTFNRKLDALIKKNRVDN